MVSVLILDSRKYGDNQIYLYMEPSNLDSTTSLLPIDSLERTFYRIEPQVWSKVLKQKSYYGCFAQLTLYVVGKMKRSIFSPHICLVCQGLFLPYWPNNYFLFFWYLKKINRKNPILSIAFSLNFFNRPGVAGDVL